MEKEIGKICAEGLSFFGKTNRLISHELKNVLAIISETLGLLGELTELSKTGVELKPGKLSGLSESIIEEVERANAIIRNMNTFAHSVDEFITEVDIRQALSLVIELSQLDSAFRKTKLRLAKSETCIIYTSPLFLEMLIYQVLNYALRGAGPGDEIRISFDCKDNDARITFSGIASNITDEFPTKKEALFAEALSGKVSIDAAAGELHIDLPQKIGESHIGSLVSND
jgi:light-regulated signal transduction histidine kinase (bacteriophytochrome)